MNINYNFFSVTPHVILFWFDKILLNFLLNSLILISLFFHFFHISIFLRCWPYMWHCRFDFNCECRNREKKIIRKSENRCPVGIGRFPFWYIRRWRFVNLDLIFVSYFYLFYLASFQFFFIFLLFFLSNFENIRKIS